ncbi:MAG: hypothetical protein FJY80_09155 [Candidatus Aminicenantes bacterium]|nr:hypothetical protein [Candidatus Aminicenantes bacterium]
MSSSKAVLVAVLTALVVVSALGLGTFVLAEEGAGICEKALLMCLADPFIRAMGPAFPIYCFEGYAFCKIYVAPLLGA